MTWINPILNLFIQRLIYLETETCVFIYSKYHSSNTYCMKVCINFNVLIIKTNDVKNIYREKRHVIKKLITFLNRK